MKVFIASDHAGFHLKSLLVPFLEERGFDVLDCGPKQYNHEDDYPDFVSRVADKVSSNKNSKGIVIGWSGQGEAMVTNRFPKIRTAVFYGGPQHILTLSRQHNNANILSLGAHFLTTEEAKKAVLLWLSTEFSAEERHQKRIEKIDQYPK